ncbi:MASE1 domain-containing protein [Streptomyces sp. NPDC052052]|uniref:MASE1 domain-containing protein n=1 Tax=Streptomyces sp. NPDC052052 TaxID=3154756 RepID=UPI0034330414
MTRSKRTKSAISAVLHPLAVAAAYYLAGGLGLIRSVDINGAALTPIWPPTGVALGALLYLGLRVWPGIALGSVLVAATLRSEGSPAFTVAIVAGNTLAPVCSFLMLRRAGFRMELDRLRDGILLVFLGALTGMIISASVGTATLVLQGGVPGDDLWPVLAGWWSGNAMGVLVVTPLLLALRSIRMPRFTDRWVEASTLLVVAVAVSLMATRSTLSMLYMVFPLLIWAALRFQLAGSAPCAFLVSSLAVLAGAQGVGPFAGHTTLQVMVNLTVLNGCVTLTALLLAAVVTEQSNIRRTIERACDELADVVDQLTQNARTSRPDDEPDGLLPQRPRHH